MTKMHCSMLQAPWSLHLREVVLAHLERLEFQLNLSAAVANDKELAQCQASIKYLESVHMGPEVIGPCHAKLKELQEQAVSNSRVKVQKGLQETVDILLQGLRKQYPSLAIGEHTPTVI